LRSEGGDSILATIADSLIVVPVDIQSRYKPPGMVLFSGTVTSSGSTSDIDVSTFSAMEILLKVTSVSGTNPSLSVYIEGKFEETGGLQTLSVAGGHHRYRGMVLHGKSIGFPFH